jgi:hypothetical protein
VSTWSLACSLVNRGAAPRSVGWSESSDQASRRCVRVDARQGCAHRVPQRPVAR